MFQKCSKNTFPYKFPRGEKFPILRPWILQNISRDQKMFKLQNVLKFPTYNLSLAELQNLLFSPLMKSPKAHGNCRNFKFWFPFLSELPEFSATAFGGHPFVFESKCFPKTLSGSKTFGCGLILNQWTRFQNPSSIWHTQGTFFYDTRLMTKSDVEIHDVDNLRMLAKLPTWRTPRTTL